MAEIYKKISWFEIGLDVNKDRLFYIKSGAGAVVNRMYGPYRLVDAKKRIMKNSKGNEFMHYAEDFYVKEASTNGN